MTNIQKEIAGLSAAEKFELIDTLLESLESEQLPFTSEQSAELDRRVALHERSPSSAVPWEEVRSRLFKER